MSKLNTILIVGLLAGFMLLAAPAWAQDVDAAAKVDPLAENSEISAEWSFSLRPYFFLSGLSGSVTVDPLTFPINSSFTTILERVELGGFLAFTAEKNRWGINADFQ